MNHIINQEIVNQIQIKYDNIPLAVFLIGANGCGKSSLRKYLNLSDIQMNIDPDILNRINKVKFPDNYQIESAKQALRIFAEAMTNNFNVCIESTLSGKGTMQRIIEAKNRGYYTLGYFVGLSDVELNLKRIAMRVAVGGHNIAENVVRRRYIESVDNLILIKNYFDLLYIIDNSESYYQPQFSFHHQRLKKISHRPEAWAFDLYTKFNG